MALIQEAHIVKCMIVLHVYVSDKSELTGVPHVFYCNTVTTVILQDSFWMAIQHSSKCVPVNMLHAICWLAEIKILNAHK